MTGYEFELQRDRNARLQAAADAERLLNLNSRRTAVDLRTTLGKQLVKLGTRLAGEARSDRAA